MTELSLSGLPDRRKRFGLAFCSDECLFHSREIICALQRHPRGGFLFKTSAETVLKKKYCGDGFVKRRFGLSFAYDPEPHNLAMQILRNARPKGVLLPIAECRCCQEFPFLNRANVDDPVQSREIPRLTETQAKDFVDEARAIVRRVHKLGVRHGDLVYHNFIMVEARLWLIDMDHAAYTGQICAFWENLEFTRRVVIPILRTNCSIFACMRACVNPADWGRIGLGSVGILLKRSRRVMHALRIAIFPDENSMSGQEL